MRTILASVFSLLVFWGGWGCRPESTIPPPEKGDTIDLPGSGDGRAVSIAWLKTLYRGAPVRITDEVRIEGTVFSSDREGNFYRTLVIGDGTGGIEVKLDVEEIFKRYMIHTRVVVRCNGLWLGSEGGTLQLGGEPFGDFQTGFLDENAVAEHLFADDRFYGEVRPSVISFEELSLRQVSTYVAFERVSFAHEERGLPWAETEAGGSGGGSSGGGSDGGSEGSEDGEPPAATERHLVDAAGDTLVVRTSRYARFAAWPLPEGVGRIEGVLGYFNGVYRLVVCDSEAFVPLRD